MDPLPPLTALRAFDAVGRTASVSSAADELHVSAAAISRQIRILEENLGIRLFYRRHRSVELTPEGAAYHAEVSKMFSGLRRATRDMLLEDRKRRVFNVWAPHTIAMRWLLPRLATLHRDHPEIEIRLHTSVVKMPDFERTDIDAGIILGTGQGDGLVFHKIMVNEIAPVCTPETARRLKHPRQLAGETLLHTHARPDDWHVWLKAANIPGIDAESGLRYESSALAYEAALSGYGVAIGQRAMIENELQDGRLVTPFDTWIDLGDFTYYFVMPKAPYRPRSDASLTFRRWVESLALEQA